MQVQTTRHVSRKVEKMRRTLVAFVLLMPTALVLVGAPVAATASETHNGTFTSGIGSNSGKGQDDPRIKKGWYPLTPSGVWSLSIGSQGVQIGGVVRSPTCPLAPCSFVMNLSGGTPWVETPDDTAVYREFTSFVDWGTVKFTLFFRYYPDGTAHLVFDRIEGCPHGWTWWEIH